MDLLSQRCHKTLNNIERVNRNEKQFDIIRQQKMEDQLLKHCRDTLKKNNLHPLKKLGKGAFSFVFSVQKIQLKSPENQVYSVKCINKKQFAKKPYLVKYIQQEIQSLRDLNHSNIVKLSRTFEDDGWIFIVMEFCDRGNIYSMQSQRENGLISFEECAYIIKSVLQGLTAIHSKNLIHRDIKAENILLISDTSKIEPYGYLVKICDLGFCRQDDENVNTFCGTTSYMAPQIFKKEIYDNKVDVWAVGVLMFRMLYGDFPFKSINMQYEINSKCAKGFNIKKMKLKHNPSITKDTFDTLSQIFNKIFKIDPVERISVQDLQQYKHFSNNMKIVKMNSVSTESESGDEETLFEKEKILFVQSIYQKVKNLRFLSNWQEICFQHYIKKISLTLLEPFYETQGTKSKIRELQSAVEKLGAYIAKNIKDNNISKLSDYFNVKAVKFSDYKEAYRLVVGHVFSKAHKEISQNISLRSQVKLELFCCHLINRIFEKQYRRQIFIHYFQWLREATNDKKFSFQTFKEWIKNDNSDKLVQTVELMNEKFYKKK